MAWIIRQKQNDTQQYIFLDNSWQHVQDDKKRVRHKTQSRMTKEEKLSRSVIKKET